MNHPTTDPQDELFDVLNPDGTPAGYAKPRREVHRDGDWHAALHIWVCGISKNMGPVVVFQKRSLTKDTFPGLLDVAVGGHVRSGETLSETVREAEEEIGLRVQFSALTYLGIRFAETEHHALRDREVQHVYAYRHDMPVLLGFRLHPDEVENLLVVGIDATLRILADNSGRSTSSAAMRLAKGKAELAGVGRDQFVPFTEGYAVAALTRLKAVLIGGIV